MNRVKPHLLSIFFGAIFLLALVGQSIAGLEEFNEEQLLHRLPVTTYGAFVTSSEFVVDVAENWQSEFLQFFLFILATIWLVQTGSSESKKPGNEGIGTDEEQLVGSHAKPGSPRWAKAGGWRTVVYSNSLLLVMAAIFLLSWLVQSLAGQIVYNQDQLEHGGSTVPWVEYLAAPDFWNRTLQNWQSEFLAVGCMVAFSIFLRQRGSAESKPVGTPHETSVSGERMSASVEAFAHQVRASGVRVAVAESLTCGMLASELGSTAGASDWLLGGVVAYSNSVKYDLLEVEEGPVVSRRCAAQMAEGVARLTAADVAIAVTGVGGPGHEDEQQPGTVFIAVAVRGITTVQQHHFPGRPQDVLSATVEAAVALALRCLAPVAPDIAGILRN